MDDLVGESHVATHSHAASKPPTSFNHRHGLFESGSVKWNDSLFRHTGQTS